MKRLWHYQRQIFIKNPLLSICIVSIPCLTALANISEVLVFEKFINAVLTNQSSFYYILIICLVLLYAWNYISAPLNEFIIKRLELISSEFFGQKITKKFQHIAMYKYEMEDCQTIFQRMKDEPEKKFIHSIRTISQIIGGLITTFGVILIALRAGWIYICCIAILILLIKYEKANYDNKKNMQKSVLLISSVTWIYDNITYIFAASSYLVLLYPLQQGKIEIGF